MLVNPDDSPSIMYIRVPSIITVVSTEARKTPIFALLACSEREIMVPATVYLDSFKTLKIRSSLSALRMIRLEAPDIISPRNAGIIERRSIIPKKLKIYLKGFFTTIILRMYSIEKIMVMTHSVIINCLCQLYLISGTESRITTATLRKITMTSAISNCFPARVSALKIISYNLCFLLSVMILCFLLNLLIMKNNRIKIIFVFLLVPWLFSCSGDAGKVRVMTLNVRYDNPADGNNAWPERREIVSDFILQQNPDVIGFQEVLWNQYEYLDSALTGWGSVGVGRDDGKQAGEMAPLFYKRKRFELADYGTFWLSETPGEPGSKGWGAVLPRIVTWVSLEDRESKKLLFVFNTHFSHMSDSARIMSSGVLREGLKMIAGGEDFIITGDFNMVPESRAYSELVKSPVADSYLESSEDPDGETYTYNGFRDEPGENRIDYIFTREGIKVKSHSTIAVKEGNLFISDHWPVIALIELGE